MTIKNQAIIQALTEKSVANSQLNEIFFLFYLLNFSLKLNEIKTSNGS